MLTGLFSATMIGFIFEQPPPEVWDGEMKQALLLNTQTPQEQVAYRAGMPLCADCHRHFDPYGLALSSYDAIGRIRTLDERGHVVDATARLPPELGAVTVRNAVELARLLARSPIFTNTMAWAGLQYAMVDYSMPVERPSLPGLPLQPACAVNDLAARFRSRPAQTFAGLLRDVATSPAFAYRRQIQ